MELIFMSVVLAVTSQTGTENVLWQDFHPSQEQIDAFDGAESAARDLEAIDAKIDGKRADATENQLETATELREIAGWRMAAGLDEAQQRNSTGFPQSYERDIQGLNRTVSKILKRPSSSDRVLTEINAPIGWSMFYISYTAYYDGQASGWEQYEPGQHMEARNHVFRLEAPTSSEAKGCDRILTVWDDPTKRSLHC